MGWFSSVCGAVGSLISGACSCVGKLFAGPIGIVLNVCVAVFQLCKALGLFKKENNVEELGDKRLQAEDAGIKLEDFKTYDEYLKKIEEFEIDPEKSKKFTPEEKARAGAELMVASLTDKYKDPLLVESFVTYALTNNRFYTPERMGELGKLLLKDGDVLKNVVGFLTGMEKRDDLLSSAVKTLMNIEKVVTPGLNDIEAMRRVMDFKKY